MGLLKQAFENGEFAVTSEMAPPKGIDFAHLRHCAQLIKGRVQAVGQCLQGVGSQTKAWQNKNSVLHSAA